VNFFSTLRYTHKRAKSFVNSAYNDVSLLNINNRSS